MRRDGVDSVPPRPFVDERLVERQIVGRRVACVEDRPLERCVVEFSLRLIPEQARLSAPVGAGMLFFERGEGGAQLERRHAEEGELAAHVVGLPRGAFDLAERL